MKKFLALTVCFAILAALLPSFSTPAQAVSATKEDALNWIRAQEGVTHGNGQCVYLVKAYYQYLVGWAAYGSGYEYQTNELPEGWLRLPGGEAQPGDILIFGQTANNSNGHVALCESEYVTYHQNYNEGGRGGPTKRIANLRYDKSAPNYWGCIRPVFSDSPKPGPSGFFDVPEDAYFAEPVLWAVNNQITNGISNTLFGPDSPCTRGQAVTFLWRAMGAPAPTADSNPFSDLEKGMYYYDAVLWAVEQGITNGMTETTFDPDRNCTRGQIITFQWRCAGSPKLYHATTPFVDVPEDAYFSFATTWAVVEGITKGMTETAFRPDDVCTRGQIVTFLSRQHWE